jgi:hypothetical protein
VRKERSFADAGLTDNSEEDDDDEEKEGEEICGNGRELMSRKFLQEQKMLCNM